MRYLITVRLLTISLVLIASFAPGCAQLKQPETAQPFNVRVSNQTPLPPPTGPKEPVGLKQNGILLVYPKDGGSIGAPSTFVIGAVLPGSTLTANGAAVRVTEKGYFAHVLSLKYGANPISLVRDGDQANSIKISVTRPSPPSAVPASPPQLLSSSAEPKTDIGVTPGDLIQFGVRGSPGSTVSVQLGNRAIALASTGNKPSVNLGLDTAYGVTYQRSPSTINDLYTGFYRIQAADTFQNAQPVFILKKNGITARTTAKGKVTVMKQPFVARTTHDKTVVRVAPGLARTTPFVEGVRVMVDGYKGDSYRCEMHPGKHLWILKEDLVADESPSIPPTAEVKTLNVEPEGTGSKLVIPLDQRLPYQVDQNIKPNKLVLKIYGGIADTDWVTPALGVEQGSAPNKTGKTFPADRSHGPVSYVTWGQLTDRLYQATVHLNEKQQWGFWVDYQDTNLVLHIKGAPNVEPGGNVFQGLTVCVDPGHGGRETGSIGCGGIKEATINLAIGMRLQRMLERAGASVVMTRKDDIDVSLADRVATAVAAKADLLISVHNNALPDGRNPWNEKGTSTYWYHPQSLAFAKHLKDSTVRVTGFNDFGTRYQNLALCRPSEMPASLVEVGFMINPDEYAELIEPATQDKAARGILEGVSNFIREALAKDDD